LGPGLAHNGSVSVAPSRGSLDVIHHDDLLGLVRDRDRVFQAVTTTARAMGIDEVLTAPRSPWQNAYAERIIGSVRRECLDHVIVLNATGLRRLLKSYVAYYNDVSYCPTSLCA
jgi:transposase InsO family protein